MYDKDITQTTFKNMSNIYVGNSRIKTNEHRDLVLSFTHRDFIGITTILITPVTPCRDLYIANLGNQSLYVIINEDTANPIEILSGTEEQLPFHTVLISHIQINGYVDNEFKVKGVV